MRRRRLRHEQTEGLTTRVADNQSKPYYQLKYCAIPDSSLMQKVTILYVIPDQPHIHNSVRLFCLFPSIRVRLFQWGQVYGLPQSMAVNLSLRDSTGMH